VRDDDDVLRDCVHRYDDEGLQIDGGDGFKMLP